MKQNGLRKEEDIMMKLLDASSDSDPEPLNLPPLKGKKLVKRKKSSYNVPNTGVCDPCSFIKVLAVILMISLLVLLGVLTVMLYNQIDGLKKTLKSVESRNKDKDTEMGTLQGQLGDLKNQVEDIKSKLNTDSKDSQELTDMKKKIEDLTLSTGQLKSAMSVVSKEDISQKLEQLTQLPVISKTVANIGSDVANLKTQIEELFTFKQAAAKQLDDLNQKISQSNDRENKPFNPDDLLQKFQLLQQTLSDSNITTWSKLGTMESVLNVHQFKFDTLENKTSQMSHLQPSGTGTGLGIPEDIKHQIESQVKESVNEMMLNKTGDLSESSITSMLSNIDNVTAIVKDLKEQFVQLKTSHSEMLPSNQSKKKDDLDLSMAGESLEALNKSVDHLSRDVSVLMNKFVQNQNSLNNITKFVDGIRQYITILESKMGLNEKIKTDDPDLAKIPLPLNISIPLDSGQNNTGSTVPPANTPDRPVIHMKLVHNATELEISLHRWDKNGNGVLDSDEMEDLPDYMPDPPTVEDLKKFDFDLNNSLDLNELKIALGFAPYPTEDERQKLADLG